MVGKLPENKAFRMFKTTLANGASQKFTVEGNFFMYYEGVGSIDAVINNSNKFDNLVPGVAMKLSPGQEFKDVTVTNTSGATQSLRLVIGFGDFIDIRSLVSINNVQADTITPSTDVSVGAAATLITPQDAEQRTVLITVPDTAANGIRVGNASVTATNGVHVGVGQSISLETNAAVYGIRDGASNVSVGILKMSRVS
jgi:hypothetical protein